MPERGRVDCSSEMLHVATPTTTAVQGTWATQKPPELLRGLKASHKKKKKSIFHFTLNEIVKDTCIFI